MRIVVPFGFYGSGNIGDEATLSGFAALLEHHRIRSRVAVGSRNPSHTRNVEPRFTYFDSARRGLRRAWVKLRADAHVFAGGTPIMDSLGAWPICELLPLIDSAKKHGAPIAFVGVGVEGLHRDDSRRFVETRIVPHVRHWSVRCEHDRSRLIEHGADPDVITVAADMAWLIHPSDAQFGVESLKSWGVKSGRRVIGVNVVNESSLFERQPRFVTVLARALDTLIETHDAQVLFLANEVRDDDSFDKAAARAIIKQMRRTGEVILARSEYFTPAKMMSIVACCDLTISMRYHFCLFSAMQAVPFVALTRSDKLRDLCWDADWPLTCEPAELDVDALVDHAQTAVGAGRGALLRQLTERRSFMHQRALANIAPLHAVIGTSPRRELATAPTVEAAI